MVKAWLTTGDNPSWKTLRDALRSPVVGASHLANVLEPKYCPVLRTEPDIGYHFETDLLKPSPVSEPVRRVISQQTDTHKRLRKWNGYLCSTRCLGTWFICISPGTSLPPFSMTDKPTSPEPQAATGIIHASLQHQHTQVWQHTMLSALIEYQRFWVAAFSPREDLTLNGCICIAFICPSCCGYKWLRRLMLHSLVPRPTEEEAKWPGFICLRIRILSIYFHTFVMPNLNTIMHYYDVQKAHLLMWIQRLIWIRTVSSHGVSWWKRSDCLSVKAIARGNSAFHCTSVCPCAEIIRKAVC